MDVRRSLDSAVSSDIVPPKSMPIPEPQDLTNCVSMVDPGASGSSSAAIAAAEEDAVIAAPAPTVQAEGADGSMGAPAEIPPEETKPEGSEGNGDTSHKEGVVETEEGDQEAKGEDEDSDWGDDDSYEYEDDDDVAFSGFLAPAPVPAISASKPTSQEGASASAPARIVEEDPGAASETVEESNASTGNEAQKRKWREPSRAAVSMSLRAQSETTGGKRRLAQDLYRIMNQDTEVAGFSLQPKSEDSMDNWVIKLFQFDEDSNLAKDMLVLGIEHIELEMKFPQQYPFEPPFVRVVRPRFKKQTGFVMNGALCMELLTKDGWNPINDIESVIVSVRSLLVVGDGRLQAASELSESRYQALLEAAKAKAEDSDSQRSQAAKRSRVDSGKKEGTSKPVTKEQIGSYSASEAQTAYSHLSDYHKKKGWDTSGWWARKG